MKAQCVVCGAEFEKRGAAKTCNVNCGRVNKAENNRRYRAANLAKFREKDRRYYAANPEKVREKKRRCYAANSAARSLGLPPILYASLKIKEKLYENGNRP